MLKQQGHFFDLNVLAYSADGQYIATGGDDGKIKLWNTSSGFCFVTFTEHTAPVTALVFTGKETGNAVISASLDGTVRAFDVLRYRNFRTMTTPAGAGSQLTSLAVDGGGEVICAGSFEPYNIFVWSLRTGRLLDVLSGHEGPVVSLSFSPNNSVLCSGSWDKSLRLWDVYKSTTATDSCPHPAEVLAVAFRPDGKQMCSACEDGQLRFFDVETGQQTSSIHAKRDIGAGRLRDDKISAETSSKTKCFNSVCYTADGACILAGGQTKCVHISILVAMLVARLHTVWCTL